MHSEPSEHDARRSRILAAMGIETWRRRVERSAGDTPAPPEPTPLPAVAPAESAAPARAAADDRPTRFRLVALTGTAGVVAGSIDSPEEYRTALGVFLALAGPGVEPNRTSFEWPLPGVGTRQGTPESASRAFLKGQVDRAGARCLVLLGEADADHLPVPERLAVPVIRGPSVQALRGDGERKRALWHEIAKTKAR